VVDEVALAVQFGQTPGRRQAYVELAGRCSAYEAASIRKLREAKLYLKLAPNWAEFCPKYLGMSKASADRVIRWLDDFGPDFFTLTQLTRVSPDEYRERIAPAMAEGAIRRGGETIKLIPENTVPGLLVGPAVSARLTRLGYDLPLHEVCGPACRTSTLMSQAQPAVQQGYPQCRAFQEPFEKPADPALPDRRGSDPDSVPRA
jgi:hypothetical protein